MIGLLLLALALASNQHVLTYYHDSLTGGRLGCGSDVYGYYDPTDPTTAAVAPWSDYECGDRLLLCTPQACTVVIVKGLCGGCGRKHLDLSRAAYQALGSYQSGGVVKIGET